jgi:hypothetical protein
LQQEPERVPLLERKQEMQWVCQPELPLRVARRAWQQVNLAGHQRQYHNGDLAGHVQGSFPEQFWWLLQELLLWELLLWELLL